MLRRFFLCFTKEAEVEFVKRLHTYMGVVNLKFSFILGPTAFSKHIIELFYSLQKGTQQALLVW